MPRSSGDIGNERHSPPAPRGPGGVQLKPDAFAPGAKPKRKQDVQRSQGAFQGAKEAPRPRRSLSRSLATRVGPTVAGVQDQASETLGRMRRFQRRVRVRLDDSVSSASTRVRRLLEKPRDRLAELENDARGRTISNRIIGLADLDRDEREVISDFSMAEAKLHQAGDELVCEGEASPEPAFIASGWACRVRIHRGGRRQIMGLLLPGDPIGLRGAAEPEANTTIGALTEVRSISARRLLTQVERSNRYPNLERAIQRAEAMEKGFLLGHIARIGGMGGYDRLADLMQELKWRLRQTGLADDEVFPMPLGERDLMSFLNLSSGELSAASRRLRRRHGYRLKRQGARLVQRDSDAARTGGFREPAGSPSMGGSYAPRIIGD